MLGVRFLATEYGTGPRHGGRIDSLNVDDNGSPVISEDKRALNENVINQGLFCLDWLMDHQAEFRFLIHERPGEQEASEIDWSTPRLVCVAGDFTRYDVSAVQQINRSTEPIRHKDFDGELIVLEPLTGVPSEQPAAPRISRRLPQDGSVRAVP